MSRLDKAGDGSYYILFSTYQMSWTGATGTVEGVLKLDSNLNWDYFIFKQGNTIATTTAVIDAVFDASGNIWFFSVFS